MITLADCADANAGDCGECQHGLRAPHVVASTIAPDAGLGRAKGDDGGDCGLRLGYGDDDDVGRGPQVPLPPPPRLH